MVASGGVLCSGPGRCVPGPHRPGLHRTEEGARFPLLRLHKVHFWCRLLLSHCPAEEVCSGHCIPAAGTLTSRFLCHSGVMLCRPQGYQVALRSLFSSSRPCHLQFESEIGTDPLLLLASQSSGHCLLEITPVRRASVRGSV